MITMKEVQEHRERFKMITVELLINHPGFLQINLGDDMKIPKGSVLDQILMGNKTVSLGNFDTCSHRFFKPKGEPEAYVCILCGYGMMRKTEEMLKEEKEGG